MKNDLPASRGDDPSVRSGHPCAGWLSGLPGSTPKWWRTLRSRDCQRGSAERAQPPAMRAPVEDLAPLGALPVDQLGADAVGRAGGPGEVVEDHAGGRAADARARVTIPAGSSGRRGAGREGGMGDGAEGREADVGLVPDGPRLAAARGVAEGLARRQADRLRPPEEDVVGRLGRVVAELPRPVPHQPRHVEADDLPGRVAALAHQAAAAAVVAVPELADRGGLPPPMLGSNLRHSITGPSSSKLTRQNIVLPESTTARPPPRR